MKKVLIIAALTTGILAVTGCGQQTPIQAQQQQQEINQETVQKIEQYIVFDQPNHAALKPEAYKNLTDKELAFAETSLANTNKMVAAGEVAYGAKPTDKLAIIDKNAAGVSKQWAYESGWYYSRAGNCWGWAATEMNWWGRWIGTDNCTAKQFAYDFGRIANGYLAFTAGSILSGKSYNALGFAVVWQTFVYGYAANELNAAVNAGRGANIYLYPAYLWIGTSWR